MSEGLAGQQTIAWWREHDDGRLASLLVVGPGPPPTFAGAWLRALGQPEVGPGAWGMVAQVPLGPLPESEATLVQEAGSPAAGTDGSLVVAAIDGAGRVLERASGVSRSTDARYDACLRAATELVAQRLGEPIVAEEPLVSGLLLARTEGNAEHIVVELTPAVVTGRGVATSLPIQSVRFGVDDPQEGHVWGPELTVGTADLVEAREEDVGLPGVARVRLPIAVVGWAPSTAVGRGLRPPEHVFGRIAIALSELRLPENIQGGWRSELGGWPVIDLALAAADLAP